MSIVAGYKWVVPKSCACSTFMWVHGLSTVHAIAIAYGFVWSCLLFMPLPLFVGLSGLCCSPAAHFFNPWWHGWVTGSSFFVSRFLLGLGFAWAWALLSSIQPLPYLTLSLWVGWHFCHAIPLLLPCYHSTYACWASFGPTIYFFFTQFTLPSTFAGLILTLSWAFLAHFIHLGILGSFQSYIPMDFC